MSEENVEAIRRVYERWREGDLRADDDLLDPLILFVVSPEFPDTGTYLGLEALADYTRALLESWTSLTIEAEAFTDAGNTIVASVLQSGVGAGSGAATEFRFFHVWTFRGRKVIRVESFRERVDALEVAGLSE
jgi:ketosteroid isomerase-like protein